MMKQIRSLAEIKRVIEGYYDRPVSVKVNLGRNKVSSYRGRLSGVYPALFTVLPDDKTYLGKTTYSYSEILCGSVRVSPL
ncbi:MAG: Veg family protein [Clostridia bacterium]|nr:Veg family protein [Clostridia bacterium]